MSLEQQVRQTAATLRASSVRLAYFGWRLRYAIEGNGGDWSVLGAEHNTLDGLGNPVIRIAETEDQYRETLGIARSTWFKLLRIGEVLRNLPLRDLEQIKLANAEALTKVDPSIVASYPWIDDAKRLSADDFALKVAQRNQKIGSDKGTEVYFRVKVPVTAKKFLEETVESFRLEHGLASQGEALEMLIADVHDRPNVMATLKTAHELIEWAKSQVRKARPESKEVAWMERAAQMLWKAYRATRMEIPHEENEEAVLSPKSPYRNPANTTWPGVMPAQPFRAGGPERTAREDSGFTGFHLHPLHDPDDVDGSDDGVEVGSEG